MTLAARDPRVARAPLFPQMRVAQVTVIDRAARLLSTQVEDLEDAGLMSDAATVRVAVDGLYRTRAKLGELLRRDGLPVPPIPQETVVAADAIDGSCPGCGSVVGSEHKHGCTL